MCLSYYWSIICVTIVLVHARWMDEDEKTIYREKAKRMFYHGYNNYVEHAYPYDELKPLTCAGQDTWGSYSLTLIDALDTLLIMGNITEFERVAKLLEQTLEFEQDINVSVFETNIRVVGGLLSAHLLSYRSNLQLEDGFPCNGPLLRLAVQAAEKLLPAFNTSTGMPYGTINFLHGVPVNETPVTCTASIGTFIIEFGALSRLTGDERFINVAYKALEGLWKHRSKIGLLGNHIDVQTGQWKATDAGIGAGMDSYFEYLVKGTTLFADPNLFDMFKEHDEKIHQYLKVDDWYVWANKDTGKITLPVFQSLDAYWPGVQVLAGNVGEAAKTFYHYYQVWKQYGGTPEFYNLPEGKVYSTREGYPLRPELIESAVYLYQATKDPFYLEAGRDILDAIEDIAWRPCGYATVKNVETHFLDDRMESFFLAETTKYLYLLFDENNFIHTQNGGSYNFSENKNSYNSIDKDCLIGSVGYIFNTEAHPIDIAAMHCCQHLAKYHGKSKRTLSGQYGCKPRPFHQKLFGVGNYIGDEESIFDDHLKR